METKVCFACILLCNPHEVYNIKVLKEIKAQRKVHDVSGPVDVLLTNESCVHCHVNHQKYVPGIKNCLLCTWNEVIHKLKSVTRVVHETCDCSTTETTMKL